MSLPAALRVAVAEGGGAVEVLAPLMRAWFAETPLDGETVRCSIEVGFQSGTDADRYPVSVPEPLDPESPWFWIGFVRQGSDGGAVVLWFAPDPALQRLREHPQWDTGNALGFDFLADAGPEADRLFDLPLAVEVLGAFGALSPASAEALEPHSSTPVEEF